EPEARLESIFETTDPAVLPLATMALEQQGIEYAVRGAGSLDALRLPPDGLDLAKSDATHAIVVRQENAGRAPRLLADPARRQDRGRGPDRPVRRGTGRERRRVADVGGRSAHGPIARRADPGAGTIPRRRA